jgi:hypothetical protein
MARHGYLGDDYGSEYDPNYDANDDRGSERGFGGGGDRQRRSNADRDSDRDFMFDDGDRNRGSGSHGRGGQGGAGFFSRMGEQAGSWFGDDDQGGRSQGSDASEWFGGSQGQRGHHRPQGGMSHYGREHGQGGFQGDYGGGRQQGGFGGRGDWDRQGSGRQSFSSHPDAHYHSWRDKQVQALDRDYQDYCREREQQFHQDFDSWRQGRQGQMSQAQSSGTAANGSSSAGSGSTGSGGGGKDELLLERSSSTHGRTDSPIEPTSTVSGDGGATMGQTPETTTGRNR